MVCMIVQHCHMLTLQLDMDCPSTPSTHRMLYVEEILREIFSYLPLQSLPPFSHWGRSSPKGVLAVARTCRAFKEPALDILWEVLPNLTPLVRCLPEASFPVDSFGVRSFRHLDEKMVIERSADLLIEQATPTSRLGYHPRLYTPRPRTLPTTSWMSFDCGLFRTTLNTPILHRVDLPKASLSCASQPLEASCSFRATVHKSWIDGSHFFSCEETWKCPRFWRGLS